MFALIARVKNLLLSPGTEWDVIDREEGGPRKLTIGYVVPLVAIPAVAIVVGLSVLGVQVAGRQHRAPILEVGLSALLFFALSILGVFLFAAVVAWLAPRFGAEGSYRQAFKVSAYSITAAMVAGILAVAPALQILALLGATYSLYLLFVGAPKVMHAPPRSAVNFSIVTTIAAIILALLVGLATMFAAAPSGNLFPQLGRFPNLWSEDVALAPPGEVDVARAPLPDAAGTLSAGGGGAVSGGDLRGATPMKLAGLNRVSVGVERRGIEGKRTVDLEAEYRDGRRYISLQILYSTTIAETLGFGGPATSEFDRETTEGYSRRRRAGDAIVVENWDNVSQTGSYGRLVGDRFYVRAAGGGGVSPDDLRAAVELFGKETLAQFEAES
ncbi:MAG: Yip1 family protein [Hyphomonadaceae bacterium]